jgi:ADP-ribosylglycohydrolase
MVGAIAGDMIGSRHEWTATKTTDFELLHPDCHFTDDTVLAVAVADCLLHGHDYVDAFHDYFHAYPGRGFGGRFYQWAAVRDRRPYNSWGNGSAMRVAAVGFACDSLDAVRAAARRSAEPTHNHPEGVKGAEATAAAIFLARTGHKKEGIRKQIADTFGYDLSRRVADIRPNYKFNESCQGTVPEAIIAFLESTSYEDAIRNAISLGGDADTLACITGGIAEAFYGGVPRDIEEWALARLDDRLRRVVIEFRTRFK